MAMQDPQQLDLAIVVDAPKFPHLPPLQTKKPTASKNSLQAMAEAALEYGRYSSLDDLLVDVARLSQHKPFNALLALLQLPAATHLLPIHRWKQRYGRAVRPGQQPIVLLIPRGPVMFLFDVSQTEATPGSRPLPSELTNPFSMTAAAGVEAVTARLLENVKADGVRVHATREGFGRAGCIWPVQSAQTQEVLLQRDVRLRFPVRYESLYNSSHSPTERFATIAHELGPPYRGHADTISKSRWPDRRSLPHEVKDREAESVARVVFSRLFPDVDMPPYRDLPPGNALPDLRGMSLKLVMDSATWILRDTLGLRRQVAEHQYESSRPGWPTIDSEIEDE